jgi:hypothetical protein
MKKAIAKLLAYWFPPRPLDRGLKRIILRK